MNDRMDKDRDQLPREKALAYGIKALADHELMAIIFGTGIKGKNVLQMCREILHDNDDHISKVARMDIREFMDRYKGIGPAKALTMLAALELGNRSAADAIKLEDIPINSSRSAYEYMKSHLDGLCHEEFWILMLKQNLRPLREVRVGQGGMTATVVDIKVLMRTVLLASSPSIMLFHNHPSGELRPSPQDKDLTKRIVDAARTLDIRVLDHIIVGNDNYFSFHDNGIIL